MFGFLQDPHDLEVYGTEFFMDGTQMGFIGTQTMYL
jgi:hypothetical protein